MFSKTGVVMNVAVSVSFGQFLIYVIKNEWFNKRWSLKSAEGKAMLKRFMSDIAGDQKYDDSYPDKIREIICDIVDPVKNPQRGEIAGEAYVQDGDFYEFTPDWAQHVLTEEIIPMITKENEKINSTEIEHDRMTTVLFKLREWDATRKGKSHS